MTNDISTSMAAISTSRMAVKRIIGSRLRRPIGDPQCRWRLVSGRADTAEPLRQDENVGAEIQWQGGQLGCVKPLRLRPQRVALVLIELDFEGVDQMVHCLAFETGSVLAGEAVGVIRDLARMKDRARHVFWRADPGIHRHVEPAVRYSFAEQHPGWLVLDARIDT